MDRIVASLKPGDTGSPVANLQDVVWSTARPRSIISSSTLRRLSENRRYQRTHVTMISG